MIRPLAVILSVILTLTAQTVRADSLEEGAGAFIMALEREAIESLTDPAKPRAERVSKFRELFKDKFAVVAIGRWTLGRNWRRASEQERAEFLKLFEDLMVATYVDRFQNYAGEGVAILKTVPVDGGIANVFTEITRPDGADAQPIKVTWRVGQQGDIFKVLDVIVEGASMSLTLQREFASIIKNTGSVSGLIEELRKKTAELNPS